MLAWLTPLLQFAADEPGQPRGFDPLQMLFPLVVLGAIWYFLLVRPQRRQQAQREKTLGELKKNDRIVTIGGIIGTVASLSQDGKEVTLKVDDNTRIRMLRSSVQNVLGDDDKTENAANDKS